MIEIFKMKKIVIVKYLAGLSILIYKPFFSFFLSDCWLAVYKNEENIKKFLI